MDTETLLQGGAPGETNSPMPPLPIRPKCNCFMMYKNQFSTQFLNLFLIFLAVSLLSSCGSGQQNAPANTNRVVSADGFRVEPSSYNVQIRSTGELTPFEEVELRTPVAGNVMSIHFEEGQWVQQGALLVKIDSRTWEAQKKGLEAQLHSAENELKRQQELLLIEGTSLEAVEQVQTRVSSLKAQIEELAVRIDLSHIRAPFSGNLSMRNFSRGAFLSQGEIITRLVQNRKLKVSFDIPARYAGLAREGLQVKVVSSSTGDTVPASVYAVDPFINSQTRSLGLRGVIENVNAGFIPGDFAQVLMDVERNEGALLVPAESIISELNAQIVFVASNGKAERRTVEIGTRTPGRVHITRGLAQGDTVLITGLMDMRNGSAVSVVRLNQEAGL